MIRAALLIASLFSISSLCLAGQGEENLPPEFAKWADVSGPTSGPAQVYGTFAGGCISGAKQLPLSGTGYTVVHKARKRFYGHDLLINYIQNLAKKIAQGKQLIVVEDMGYARGGPFYTGHASHQIGMDADISLTVLNKDLSQTDSDNWVSISYVTDRKIMKSNWGADQVRLVSTAASFPEVNRIFVAPGIKKYFCDTNPSAPWLYKLRSWWGHDDHIHVRLSCPKDSPHCQSQAALDPKDNGCVSDIDWWFSAEAEKEWQEMEQSGPSPNSYPKLPAYCSALARQ